MAEDRYEGEDEETEAGEQSQQNGSGDGLASKLFSKEVLIPLAASAASAGIAYAAKKGPDLMNKLEGKGEDVADSATSKLGEKGGQAAKQALGTATSGGGIGSMAAGAMKAVGGGGGGDKGKTRRLPIQRWTDVAVPVEEAFEAWTRFEDFPKFMHRVLSVEEDGNELTWQEKIWFSKRQWKAEITEKVENERIAWKTTSGTGHTGAVTFHRLDDNLTRVMVTLDFHPSGMIEKMASGLRFVKRAVQADLARFKAYVELGDEEERAPETGESEESDEPTGRERRAQSGDGERQEQSGDDDRDSEERERERRERQARREQRQEKVGS